jgi:hypothetical protein
VNKEPDIFSVLVGDKRVEVSVDVSEWKRVKLRVFTNNPHNPHKDRFTDEDAPTFWYKDFGSPKFSMENDQELIGVLRQALDAWRRHPAP